MSSADNGNGELANRFEEQLREEVEGADVDVPAGEDGWGEMSLAEIGSALEELGADDGAEMIGDIIEDVVTDIFVTKEDLEAHLTGDASGPDGDRLEAYGTGVEGEESRQLTAAERRRFEELTETNDDPADYGTGVAYDGTGGAPVSPSDELLDLVGADSREDLHEIVQKEADEDLEAYGTGIAGDASKSEHDRREETVELMADALERVAERRNGEE